MTQLAACTETASRFSSSLEDTPPTNHQCAVPVIVRYTDDFQKASETELQAIYKAQPHIAQMIVDYGKLRNAIRKISPSQ